MMNTGVSGDAFQNKTRLPLRRFTLFVKSRAVLGRVTYLRLKLCTHSTDLSIENYLQFTVKVIAI